MTSELASVMADIVKASVPALKNAGFTKRRHSFNRSTSDSLVHVVHFWMAPAEPPAWTEVRDLRERLYGNFRLDFGVFAAEMSREGAPQASWVNEYNCQLRRTIGQLVTDDCHTDLWWPIDETGAVRAVDALTDHGLPWLNRFPTKAAVLAEFEEHGALAIGMSPAGALDIADLHHALGRPADERRTLTHYVEQTVLAGHAPYLRSYLEERGHADLVARVRTRAE